MGRCALLSRPLDNIAGPFNNTHEHTLVVDRIFEYFGHYISHAFIAFSIIDTHAVTRLDQLERNAPPRRASFHVPFLASMTFDNTTPH